MSLPGLGRALEDELTELVAATPGVTRLYPASPAVPFLGDVQRIATELIAPTAPARVRIDEVSSSMSASIAVDLSASATDIGAAVCSRITSHLAAIGADLSVTIVIAYVAS